MDYIMSFLVKEKYVQKYVLVVVDLVKERCARVIFIAASWFRTGMRN